MGLSTRNIDNFYPLEVTILKKLIASLVLTTAVLVGCGAPKNNNATSNSTDASTAKVEHAKVDLKLYSPDYSLETKTFGITGKATPESDITVTVGDKKETVKTNVTGSFSYRGELVDKEVKVVVSDGEKDETVELRSLSTIKAEIAEKERLAELERQKEAAEK